MQCPNGFGFGSRFVAILEAVERTGSIKHAAAEVGWSYRHVWDRVKRAEEALGCALVATQRGGQGKDRSELTPDVRRIVSRFHELCAAFQPRGARRGFREPLSRVERRRGP